MIVCYNNTRQLKMGKLETIMTYYMKVCTKLILKQEQSKDPVFFLKVKSEMMMTSCIIKNR